MVRSDPLAFRRVGLTEMFANSGDDPCTEAPRTSLFLSLSAYQMECQLT